MQLYDKEQLPFDSTAIRFGDSVPQDIGPGNGTAEAATHTLGRLRTEQHSVGSIRLRIRADWTACDASLWCRCSGAYDPGNRLNFVSQLGQKTVGRKGIFGSCAPRFIERKAKTQPAPGPGAYEPKAAKGLPGQVRSAPPWSLHG